MQQVPAWSKLMQTMPMPMPGFGLLPSQASGAMPPAMTAETMPAQGLDAAQATGPFPVDPAAMAAAAAAAAKQQQAQQAAGPQARQRAAAFLKEAEVLVYGFDGSWCYESAARIGL